MRAAGAGSVRQGKCDMGGGCGFERGARRFLEYGGAGRFGGRPALRGGAEQGKASRGKKAGFRRCTEMESLLSPI